MYTYILAGWSTEVEGTFRIKVTKKFSDRLAGFLLRKASHKILGICHAVIPYVCLSVSLSAELL